MAEGAPAESTSIESPAISGDSRIRPFDRPMKRKRSKRPIQSMDSPSSDEEHIAICLLMLSGSDPSAKLGHPCSLCGKSFPSYHALGGHMTSHRKPLSPVSPHDCVSAESSKIHQCLICFRIFPSGQALGGHKRRHFDGTLGSAAGAGSASDDLIHGAVGSGSGLDLNLPPVNDFAGSLGRRCLDEDDDTRSSPSLKKPYFVLSV